MEGWVDGPFFETERGFLLLSTYICICVYIDVDVRFDDRCWVMSVQELGRMWIDDFAFLFHSLYPFFLFLFFVFFFFCPFIFLFLEIGRRKE